MGSTHGQTGVTGKYPFTNTKNGFKVTQSAKIIAKGAYLIHANDAACNDHMTTSISIPVAASALRLLD